MKRKTVSEPTINRETNFNVKEKGAPPGRRAP